MPLRLIQELARRPPLGRTPDAEPHQDAGMASGMGFTHTSTQPNIFGGHDEYRGGVLVSSSQPNIFGGFDKTVFSLNGHGDQHAHAHGDSALSDIIGYHEP